MDSLRIGVDSGGTFTDVCLLDEETGRISVWKLSSTPDDPSVAIAQSAREAVERARAGDGPSFIHCKFDRFYGHYEGDPQTYRVDGEVEGLRRDKDPLTLFRARVTEAGLLEDVALDAIDSEALQLIEDAVTEAKAAPEPPIESLLTDVYVSY